jgi:3-oxoacyl-[acyl-carrier protein] reductase
MNLDGARVLVTGGGTGIGYSTAKRLRARGARVAICGRRADVLRAAGSALDALAVSADVSREDDVVALVRAVQEAFGGLDALVNNAAFGYSAPLLEVRRERFDEVFATNVTGAMLVGREAARVMVEQGSGTIVNIGSTAAQRGYAGGSAYAASKFALAGLTECWRAELRTHGIRVMQIDPSEVVTPFGGRADLTENPTKLRADDVAQVIESALALDDRGFLTHATLWATNPR